MTKIVQVAGGPADSEDQYVGPERELRVDESNKEIRVHDGLTPGGHRVLARDANDERYQQKSVELNGINFPAARRGFLARIADGVYALRQMVGVANQITVVNGNGVSGNPTIGLAEIQDGAHSWTGEQTYAEEIQAEGGIAGDLFGDSAGTHTGPVVGNVLGDLTGDSTGIHTGPQVGSVDVRGQSFQASKQLTLAMFTDGAVEDFVQLMDDYLNPPGTIKLYIGDLELINAPWYICDGTNGTPNWAGIIPIGFNASIPLGTQAGSATHSHTGNTEAAGTHGHDLDIADHILTTAEMPEHTHYAGIVDSSDAIFNRGGVAAVPTRGNSVATATATGDTEPVTSATGGGDGHTHAGSIAESSGSHSHPFTSEAASNLPRVIGVCFIMKGA